MFAMPVFPILHNCCFINISNSHTQEDIEFVSTKNCSYNVASTENMDLNVMTTTTTTQQIKLIS
jgi:hypothetical protein